MGCKRGAERRGEPRGGEQDGGKKAERGGSGGRLENSGSWREQKQMRIVSQRGRGTREGSKVSKYLSLFTVCCEGGRHGEGGTV